MEKKNVLIPCEEGESTGCYTSDDGQSLAHVKDVEAYVLTGGELQKLLHEVIDKTWNQATESETVPSKIINSVIH